MPIRYRSGYKYQLCEDYTVATGIIGPEITLDNHSFISMDIHGVLTIRRGYAWDGPSGPTFDTRNFMRGSLVHDALYQLIGDGLLSIWHRAAADNLLRSICREDGMSAIRAWWVYTAVRLAGGASARSPEPAVITAP